MSPLEGSGACDDAREDGKGGILENQEVCVPEQKLVPSGFCGTIAQPSSESPMDHSGMTIIRLPRNGPKPGQSTEAWLYGKQKHEQKMLEQERWKALRNKKRA